jgi:GDP-fucose transporter C1
MPRHSHGSLSSDAPPKIATSTKAALPDAVKTPAHSTLYIFCCIGYYFIVSLSLTFLNKMVLTTMIKFACPLFMTWLQFVVAFACLKILGYAGRWFPSIPHTIGVRNYDFSADIFKKTLRLGLAYVAM